MTISGVLSSPKRCTRPRSRAERRVGREQVLRGDAPDRQHELRLEQRDLAHEVGQAGGDLLRLRIAVARRPALEHVGDEYVAVARTRPMACSMASSSCPAAPTKGSPRRSSSAPGRLADHEPVGLRGCRRRTRPGCAWRAGAQRCSSALPRAALATARLQALRGCGARQRSQVAGSMLPRLGHGAAAQPSAAARRACAAPRRRCRALRRYCGVGR